MQIGIVGLGRMGGNIARRLLRNGHSCVVYDARPEARQELARDGASPANDIKDFIARLKQPRIVWVMLPAGEITEKMIEELAVSMDKDDIVIDGGNTFWQDDVRRGKALRERGLHYVDVGTSGGIWASSAAIA